MIVNSSQSDFKVTTMKTRTSLAIMAAGAVLAGCAGNLAASRRADASPGNAARSAGEAGRGSGTGLSSSAYRFESYKTELAQHISDHSAGKVYPGRPQALLRAVIVLKYSVDADGRLVHTGIVRSNHDHVAEQIALASLKSAAPFPKPHSHLLRQGKVEIAETWLFNNDGQFQVRSVALAQMDDVS